MKVVEIYETMDDAKRQKVLKALELLKGQQPSTPKKTYSSMDVFKIEGEIKKGVHNINSTIKSIMSDSSSDTSKKYQQIKSAVSKLNNSLNSSNTNHDVTPAVWAYISKTFANKSTDYTPGDMNLINQATKQQQQQKDTEKNDGVVSNVTNTVKGWFT